jgi:hypothetical protein
MRSDQVQIAFQLPNDLLSRFKRAVFEKYGTLYGAMKKEHARAIENHIAILEQERKEGEP